MISAQWLVAHGELRALARISSVRPELICPGASAPLGLLLSPDQLG
jgi:hypothetical protein